MVTSKQQVERFKSAGLRAGRWFVNSQFRLRRPYWDANHGRFMYNRYLPDGRTVLGLSWTQARGIFVLLAGWELSGDKSFLESALLAGEYIKILQIYDSPDDPRRQYAIREEVPQSGASAPRDATEAALGLLFLYRATGREDYLRRVVDYVRWFQANAWGPNGWPCDRVRLDGPGRRAGASGIHAAHGILFHHLRQATGDDGHLESLVRVADGTLRRFVRADGSVRARTKASHHAGAGGLMFNDDGLMVSLLCAHVATGEAKYLEACLRHAEWVRRNVTGPLAILAGLPCMCTFMIELSAVTGEPAWRDWAAKMLARHVLPLQVRNSRDPLSDGAFRGEDEPVEYYGPKRARKTDFITTRMTCYSALACLKLAGIVGPYYGALGWERRPRRPGRLPNLSVE